MGLILFSILNIVARFSLIMLINLSDVVIPQMALEIDTVSAEAAKKVDYAQRTIIIDIPKKDVVLDNVASTTTSFDTIFANGNPGSFTGRLTSYHPYCNGCSSVGNVACHTKDGGKHSLIHNGQEYSDSIYGSVRIVAADRAVPCGSILRINSTVFGNPVIAVVLDRGGGVKNDLFDIAFSEQGQGFGMSYGVQYDILRWGW